MTDRKVVTFGEIMLRLATPGYLRFGQARDFSATFGEPKPMSRCPFANYGIPVSFVTRLPENDIARSCVADLRGYGVDTSGIVYGGDRVGIFYLETGAVARASKVIYDRAHSAMSEIRPGMVDWDRVFSGAGVVPLDGNHACDIRKCGHGVPGGGQGCPESGPDGILRP